MSTRSTAIRAPLFHTFAKRLPDKSSAIHFSPGISFDFCLGHHYMKLPERYDRYETPALLKQNMNLWGPHQKP